MRLRRMNNNNFLLYTRCMTYNHSSYIVDAMNGFCMQKTTFPFVNVIVDDASTDGEPEVIEQYLQENFNLDDSPRNPLVFATYTDQSNSHLLRKLLHI